MKMKVVDVIRKTSDEQIANIIGAVIVRHTYGISAEEAVQMDFPNTLKELQREIEIDYKPTNADRIRAMSDEELAELITSGELCAICPLCKYYGTESCYMENGGVHKNCDSGIIEWLKSEAEVIGNIFDNPDLLEASNG